MIVLFLIDVLVALTRLDRAGCVCEHLAIDPGDGI